jgi:hypothetical protein
MKSPWAHINIFLMEKNAYMLPNSQGCSILPKKSEFHEIVRIEGVFVESLRDVFDEISPKDVEGEGSQQSESCGIDSDSRGVFAEGDVADVMVCVLDAPMPPCGTAIFFCGSPGRRDVEGRLLGSLPFAGFRILAFADAPDFDDFDDDLPPFPVEGVARREDAAGAPFDAVPRRFLLGAINVGRLLPPCDDAAAL